MITIHQRYRQTDRRHAIPRPRICSKVHCAVKIQSNREDPVKHAETRHLRPIAATISATVRQLHAATVDCARLRQLNPTNSNQLTVPTVKQWRSQREGPGGPGPHRNPITKFFSDYETCPINRKVKSITRSVFGIKECYQDLYFMDTTSTDN